MPRRVKGAKAAQTPSEKVHVLRQLADLYRDRLRNDVQAINTLKRMIELKPSEIIIRMSWRDPDAVIAYLTQSGCDPDRALRNSLGFIAGAVEHFGASLAAGYEAGRFRVEWIEGHAVIHVPES